MKNFEPSKIRFGDAKAVGKQGARIVYVSYNDRPLIMQTPEMNCPWGLSNPDKDAKGPAEKLSIALSFKGKEFNAALQKAFEKGMEFDDVMLQGGIDNCMPWFKAKYTSKEVVQALYTPFIKFSKDPNTLEITDKYPPSIRFSVPVKDGKIPIDCYDENRQPMELTETTDLRGAKVTAIVQCSGVWLIGGNKFVPSWKVLQLKVKQSASTIKGFAFKDDEEGEEECDIDADADADVDAPVSSKPKAVASVATKKEKEEELLPESDVEEEEDELEKPKPVKKTLVVKKKVAA